MQAQKKMAFGAARLAGLFALTALAAAAQAQETFKIGVVSFLSGQAAESFGIPAVNGAKVLVEAFNKGEAPAPYNKAGIGGMKIEAVYVDENGGATKQVQELRNLYDREKVDAVVGYVSSGDCLAVAPVAEELKKFLILYDCGTPRVFEDAKYSYVFRTASHGTMDNVALARYLKARNIKAESYNLINQDYAWGHDSRADFKAAMSQLYPQAKVGEDLLPKFGAGQYGTEISALTSKRADVTHSSLWGGDLQAFVLQSGPRGLFKRSQVVLSAADHVLTPLGDKMPDGTILGARGAYGLLAPKSALNDWWWSLYEKGYNTYPAQAPYRMAQALMGLKLAAEKAMAANGGKKPTSEQLAAALKGSEWDAPGGRIRMTLGDGQQATQPTAIGKTRYDAGKKMVLLEDIQRFPAECVNPPAGVKSEDWIKGGMQGAKCE
ncbi:ABC transporter substrate-binding protein [Pseudorhodoferax sp. Leaf265]|jgi:branched-chain amino acid transport system substrate-binding protein|uniref:ABC transporter substrate-binding protein n=1 Tax=Pseudorhodoferax sp. Leaf265 TaxID=1736315 RepID=UPI0007021701|nr:ABC transporter substrate-binding protein [Pseudorhodoferax sp. Leaf265]KQP08501.1 ABC transporter substrate-binding protein [Pseudorhodoferax sp. Leaf265]